MPAMPARWEWRDNTYIQHAQQVTTSGVYCNQIISSDGTHNHHLILVTRTSTAAWMDSCRLSVTVCLSTIVGCRFLQQPWDSTLILNTRETTGPTNTP